jgi:hypothetical protein
MTSRTSKPVRGTTFPVLIRKHFRQYYDIADKSHTQIAQWAPVGHGLVYVYLNNIYYLEHPSGEAKAVTSDGDKGVIYNGVPDWVYEGASQIPQRWTTN